MEENIMRNLLAGIKRSFNRYLERMAEENRKNFGNQRLDCCTINKRPKPQTANRPAAHQ